MATFDKRNGRYLARVRFKGISKSKAFRTLVEAKEWAVQIESNIINKSLGKSPANLTFGDILNRYIIEVVPSKKSPHKETVRLHAILRDSISDVFVKDLSPVDFSEWRDMRLKSVQGSTVTRELNMLSGICNYAMKEWGVLNINPISRISRPKPNKPRTRRFSDDEIRRLCLACDFEELKPPKAVMHKVAICMLFAIETAMRAGEICGLKWNDIDFERRLAHLKDTKNGYDRDVPLSKKALELLGLCNKDNDFIFDITPPRLDANFRKAKSRAMIDDIHFHDTRREALTRISKKVDVMLLAKISGHRDIKILLNTYYAPNMGDVADLLD